MPIDTCGECGRNVQREKAETLLFPDFENGDPERAWPGGPVIFCRSCFNVKRPRRIKKMQQARRKVTKLNV